MSDIRLILLLLILLPPAVTAAPLRLSDEAVVSPHGHLELLFDRTGALTPETAMASDDWRPLPAGLQLGFTTQTVWVRMTLQRGADAPPEWVLKLSNPLIDDARLYRHEQSIVPPGTPPPHISRRDRLWRDNGGWRELRAGENHDRDDWPVDYPRAVFPLLLGEELPTTLLVRLQTKNAMSASFTLMPLHEFGDFSRREAFVYGVYAGFCLLMVLFHAAFWRMTRAPDSGWYLGYLSAILATMLLSAGVPQHLLRLPVTISDPLLGITLPLGVLPLGVIFAARQLQLARFYPRLQRWLVRVSIALCAIAIAAVLSGHFGIGMPIAQLASLVLIPLFSGLALHLWMRGHRPARFFLVAFGIFYAGVIISFLRNLGVLPSTFFTDNATTVGVLLHMTLMSLRIIGHYNQLKRDNAAAQTEMVATTRALNDSLEQQVATRTAELRAALDNETRIRDEQREFVAMVSHEFRTPLAIIETSAQQIARNPDAIDKTERRCHNIREAAERMRVLVDDYLSNDRMADTTALQRSDGPLDQLLLDATAEWPPEQVRVVSPPALTLNCDHGLLQVALRNLIANGCRHAPDDTVELRCEAGPAGLRFTVSNPCAAAIPDEERAHLFQKYYRGRQAQQSPGAGLGLYLVRHIARLHGGDVTLVDAGDDGVVSFELRLPPGTTGEPAS